MTLDRSECFGPCPIYSISIHGDGTVIYHGKKYVSVVGKRVHKIPVDDVRKLIDEFNKLGYFSLKDEYTQVVNADGSITHVSDLPGTTTSIKIKRRKKTVYNYFGGPEALRKLERKIDEISQSARYVRRISSRTRVVLSSSSARLVPA